MASKRAAETDLPRKKKKKCKSRIQIREKMAKLLWHDWVNAYRKKIGFQIFPETKTYDYMFAKVVVAAETTHEEFMLDKLQYK